MENFMHRHKLVVPAASSEVKREVNRHGFVMMLNKVSTSNSQDAVHNLLCLHNTVWFLHF